VGGKTAVDTSLGKNLIGTFYYPKVIINDLDLLKTLSAKGIMNGLAEIIKMGCIFDAEILTLSQDEYSFEAMMLKAIEAKIAVITQDPFDKGLRQILNFGHTIGHALEALSDFELCHGEAVAIGCITESYLSFQSGYLSKEDFLKIERIYKTHFKDIQLPKNYQRNALLQCMEFDKKKSKEGIRFVLIDTIGHALARKGQFCHPVKLGDLETALSYMEQHCGRF
jgi:3-dehydroquinate synthase